MTGVLRIPRFAALTAITVLVTAASLVSFAESYRGLYEWAGHHGLTGIWAAGFPLQVDTFIAVGELALFVALADRWAPRSRAAAWLVTVLGVVISVAGNVGHITGHSLASRATAAVPPLAAASALAVGLGVLKRVVAARHQGTENPAALAEFAPAGQCSHGVAATAQEAVVAAFVHGRDCLGVQPSQRQLAAQFGVSRAKVAELIASLNGQPDSAPGTDLAAIR